jgi:hypothetical protein
LKSPESALKSPERGLKQAIIFDPLLWVSLGKKASELVENPTSSFLCRFPEGKDFSFAHFSTFYLQHSFTVFLLELRLEDHFEELDI